MTLRNGLLLVIILGWAWLATEYVNRSQFQPSPAVLAAILAIPVITVVVTATNPVHYLAIGPDTPPHVGGGPAVDWGAWHLIFMTYAFIVSLVPVAFLLREFQTAHGVHRRQLLFLLCGFGIAFLGLNDYLLIGAVDSVPNYIRLSPFLLLLTGSLWLVALFEHQLFGLIPVSRRKIVQTLSDPVITVDEAGRVLDINPAASELFGVSDDVAGVKFDQLCAAAPAVWEAYNQGSETEVSITADGTERHFLLNIEQLRDGHGGEIIVLREVTKQKAYERELEQQRDSLEILNQVVRHDIRNDMTVALGRGRLLEDHVDEAGQDDLETVLESTESAVELTKTARDLSEIMLSTEADVEPVRLPEHLKGQIRHARSKFQNAVITADSVPDVRVQGDELLEAVFQNLIHNAVAHNDKGVANVEISTAVDENTVTVEVADNGPGIPDGHKEEIFNKGEKGLESEGTGIGLYLVQTLIEQYGGDVWVEDNDPEGSVFGVELPLAD